MNKLDVQEGDKIEICDMNIEGRTNNIRTVVISQISISDNELSFIDNTISINKKKYISIGQTCKRFSCNPLSSTYTNFNKLCKRIKWWN